MPPLLPAGLFNAPQTVPASTPQQRGWFGSREQPPTRLSNILVQRACPGAAFVGPPTTHPFNFGCACNWTGLVVCWWFINTGRYRTAFQHAWRTLRPVGSLTTGWRQPPPGRAAPGSAFMPSLPFSWFHKFAPAAHIRAYVAPAAVLCQVATGLRIFPRFYSCLRHMLFECWIFMTYFRLRCVPGVCTSAVRLLSSALPPPSGFWTAV